MTQDMPMNSGELTLKLFVVLSRATRAIYAQVEHDIKQHGFHPTEFAVMELLYHKGSQPIQKIGEQVLLSSGSITYVVDKLEKRDYLTRMPCPKDRRVIHTSLTEQGTRLMDDIFPKHQTAIERIFGGLEDEEKQHMMALLKKAGIYAQQL